MSERRLAVLGGRQAFAEPLHVGRPNVGNRERFLARVNEVIERRWFTNDGPFVLELERRVAAWLGVKHCVAVCNGTVGLELAIRALGLTGEVIVPSFTFIATAHALQWQDLTPVFCDIRPDTHTLDPTAVERMITPRTTGIIGVHLWGQPCDVNALSAIARSHGLKLLYDAAHAFGCEHLGRKIGSFGDAEVFSFHATKVFGTAEGGAITTDDDELATKCRLMRNFGFQGYDRVDYIGTNGKMSELSAAMGLTNLEDIDAFIDANAGNYRAYRAGLAGIPGVHVLRHAEDERRNHHNVVLEIDEAASGLTRDALIQVLRADNVLARKYFWPGCHRMEPYRSYFPNAHLLLPHTERVAARVVSLPTGASMHADEIAIVCDIVRTAVNQSAEVMKAIETGHRQMMGSCE